MMTKQPWRYVENPKIRSMRVRSWFYAVSQASGLTVGELEKEFREEGSAQAPRSCIWNKYKRGEVVPRSRFQGDGRPKLVERVEARYPGTEKWLFSPLWRLADEAPMEMSEIRRIYEGLPMKIRNFFILPPELASEVFWRHELLDIEPVLRHMLASRTGDDLLAGLAMVREAELVQSVKLYQYGVEITKSILRSLDWDELEGTTIPMEFGEILRRHWAKGLLINNKVNNQIKLSQ
ncbi:MAG: hypothetical protein WBK19_13120 [Azonexus sp.]